MWEPNKNMRPKGWLGDCGLCSNLSQGNRQGCGDTKGRKAFHRKAEEMFGNQRMPCYADKILRYPW